MAKRQERGKRAPTPARDWTTELTGRVRSLLSWFADKLPEYRERLAVGLPLRIIVFAAVLSFGYSIYLVIGLLTGPGGGDVQPLAERQEVAARLENSGQMEIERANVGSKQAAKGDAVASTETPAPVRSILAVKEDVSGAGKEPQVSAVPESGAASEPPIVIAGVRPSARPAQAPIVREFKKNPAWYAQALTGLREPYPRSLRFLEDQGAWYTPFARPGMTGPYDIRGRHRSTGKSGQQAM